MQDSESDAAAGTRTTQTTQANSTMATRNDLTALLKAREVTRRAISQMWETIREFCSAPRDPAWSDDVEIQLRVWESRTRELKQTITEIDKSIYDQNFADVNVDSGFVEQQEIADFSDKIEYVFAKIDVYRTRFGKSPASVAAKTAALAAAAAANDEQAALNRALVTVLQRLAPSEEGERPESRLPNRALASATNCSHEDSEEREQRPGGDMTAILNRLVLLQESNASGAAQLPAPKLQRFGGEQSEFLAFISEFRRLVHERQDLADLQRFKILKDLLHGDAERVVTGIPLTDEGYGRAISALKRRYGSIETIMCSVYQKMLQLPKVAKVDPVMLRDLLDKVANHVTTLDMIKIKRVQYSSVMYMVLLQSIPESLANKFLDRYSDEEFVDDDPRNLVIEANDSHDEIMPCRFLQLQDFLRQEVHTKERTRTIRFKEAGGSGGSGGHGAGPSRDSDRGKNGGNLSQRRFGWPNAGVYAMSGKGAGSRRNSHVVRNGADNNNANNFSKSRGAWSDRNEGKMSQGNRKRRSSECIFCDGDHHPFNCSASVGASAKRRKIQAAGVCSRCLRSDHLSKDCRDQTRCQVCQKPHVTAACYSVPKSPRSGDNNRVQMVAAGAGSLLPTGHVRVSGEAGVAKIARFLLDSGSQKSFITTRLAKSLGLPVINHEDLYLHVFGGCRPAHLQRLPIVLVTLITRENKSFQMRAAVIDQITADLLPRPSGDVRAKLKSGQLAEHPGGPPELDILLNAADTFSVMTGGHERQADGKLVIGTMFGDVIVGPPEEAGTAAFTAAVAAPSLDRFWNLEILGVLPEELKPERDLSSIVAAFTERIRRLPNGKYQVCMNLKPSIAAISNNRPMASQQLRSLAKRLSKDTSLKKEYVREMRAFIEGGFAEKPPPGSAPLYTMPHFPVIRPDKETYRVRPVFNASAAEKGKLSLNDCIYDTPNLLPCPLEALTNFRRYDVAFSADISKAYLMVHVNPDQRDYLSFLWFKNDATLTGEETYRMTTTSFGVKDSQFNVITIIREHAAKFELTNPAAVQRLNSHLYMDDLLTGADTPEEAERLWKDVTHIMLEAGMSFKKFKTNHEELRKKFGSTNALNETQVLLPPEDVGKVLGVGWDEETDSLTFNPEAMSAFVSQSPATMRTLLGACARLYDPQGVIAPFTMLLKLILQEAHQEKVTLQAELPQPLLKRWRQWCAELIHLAGFRLPRSLRYQGPDVQEVELHVFCDASQRAYAAVAYTKAVLTDGTVVTRLVAAKTRLAPLKQLDSLTIPKKELMAAVLAVRLAKKINTALNLREEQTYFWSDAQVVLHWIHSGKPERWGLFVKNRLIEILRTTATPQWNHCAGANNPADLPTRGLPMQRLNDNSLWLEGPDFLKNNKVTYPTFKADLQMITALPETKAFSVSTTPPRFDPASFSSLYRCVRVAAWLLRALKRFKERVAKAPPTLGPLLTAELSIAKQRLIMAHQDRYLGETKDSLSRGELPEDPIIAAFKPFICEQGFVRIGGRLQDSDEPYEVRHPILLKDDAFTRLLIQDAHEGRMKHLKTDAVVSYLRERYWILRMRQIVKSVIHKCTGCARDSSKVPASEEAPLPHFRVEASLTPFKTTGLDYMGPFIVKLNGKAGKIWVALFTCAVVRAVHLEVVEDLSAGACLEAIKRFAARYGVPDCFVTDNALTFKKAEKCLVALWQALGSEATQNYLGQNGVKWEYIVPRASWWGGFYERMVRVTKNCLRKTMKSCRLSLMPFITVLHEVASAVNQRPLTHLPESAEAPRALTPAHFVTPNLPLAMPPGQLRALTEKPAGLLQAWRHRERVLNGFWKRWRNEYLLLLRTALRRKGQTSHALKSGDVVIIQADAPRAFWQLGLIDKELPGRDGVIRAYRVHTGKGQYVTRAGRHLAKLSGVAV